MRLLLDQNIERRMAINLRGDGHDVHVVGVDERPGLSDIEILRLAFAQNRILITKDRDFGELVFRHQEPHAGVIFLRVRARDFTVKWNRLAEVLQSHAGELREFLVVTDREVRVRRIR